MIQFMIIISISNIINCKHHKMRAIWNFMTSLIFIACRKTSKQNVRVIVEISEEKPVTSNILWKRRNEIKIVFIRGEVVTMKSFLPLNLTRGAQSGETCTQTCVKSWGTSRWSISERMKGTFARSCKFNISAANSTDLTWLYIFYSSVATLSHAG